MCRNQSGKPLTVLHRWDSRIVFEFLGRKLTICGSVTGAWHLSLKVLGGSSMWTEEGNTSWAGGEECSTWTHTISFLAQTLLSSAPSLPFPQRIWQIFTRISMIGKCYRLELQTFHPFSQSRRRHYAKQLVKHRFLMLKV